MLPDLGANQTLLQLDILLTGGRLTPHNRKVVADAYGNATLGPALQAAQRAMTLTPEFQTLGKPEPHAVHVEAAPAPGPGGEEAKNAKFGRVNDMNAKSMMPEQGFSGRLVRHDDSETHISDWQEEYGPKADHMSMEDICAMYPNNQWCKMNNRLMKRHKKRKYHYYTTTPSAQSPAPVAEWHEHANDAVEDAGDAVQDAGGAIGDAVKGAHDTVKDWLGIGGEENKTEEQKAGKGKRRDRERRYEGGSDDSYDPLRGVPLPRHYALPGREERRRRRG